MTPTIILVLFWFSGTADNGMSTEKVDSPEICEELGKQFVAKGVTTRRYDCLVSGSK